MDTKFDVLAFVKQTNYPVKEVVVYANAEAAAKYVEISKKRQDAEDHKDGKKVVDALTEELEKVGDELRASAVIFTLRGLSPKRVQDIVREPEDEADLSEKEKDAASEIRGNTLIATTIIKVTDAEGNESERPDADGIVVLKEHLKEGEFGKIFDGVVEVNFNAAIVDDATDAGFSGRHSDAA